MIVCFQINKSNLLYCMDLNLIEILTCISGLTFLSYGVLCLFAGGMRKEFARYGLSKYRKFVGFLEILGGAGSLIGLNSPIILLLSSAGLSLLMLAGTITRYRIKDPLKLMLPAIVLMVLNIFIFQSSFL